MFSKICRTFPPKKGKIIQQHTIQFKYFSRESSRIFAGTMLNINELVPHRIIAESGHCHPADVSQITQIDTMNQMDDELEWASKAAYGHCIGISYDVQDNILDKCVIDSNEQELNWLNAASIGHSVGIAYFVPESMLCKSTISDAESEWLNQLSCKHVYGAD